LPDLRGTTDSVETVTILITDMVGSTGLESRVGPAVANRFRAEQFDLLRAEILKAGGREVKNIGDGLMVAFSSAAAAVSCAVSMQQRLERRNRAAEEQLLIRVGISLGDATRDGDDYFGMPVIEAARLCDRCSGAQILVTALVAQLAAARTRAFVAVGALELKGLPRPVETVEVVWRPLDPVEGTMPLPARLQSLPPSGFVGRANELALLRRSLGEAQSGRMRLVLLSGEPGIGKTRLATHAALAARAEGAIVLYGRCNEELQVPYAAWVEALSHYVEHAPEAVLRAHVDRHGGELARLVPALRSRVAGLPAPSHTDPETERYLLWGALVGLMREASATDLLVVVLDDLQWADKQAVVLLKHVLAEGHAVRSLIIATYRDSDLQRGHPMTELLADLHREHGVERLAIGGLGQPEIVDIMQRAGGHELDEAGIALSHELHRETDGNPFYTGEILRHLRESGTIYRQQNGRFTVRGELTERGRLSGVALPQSVREVLGRRVDRLGSDTATVLSVAATIGREFDLELLAVVSERSEDELLELLEEAVAASVLTESASTPGRFAFAHALISHTLYEELGNTRRARRHRRIAEALESGAVAEPGARVRELAHHWSQATMAVDIRRATDYARMAGMRALDELAPDEAMRWFTQALELLGGTGEEEAHRELLVLLGDAQRQAGNAAYRETLIEAARLSAEAGDADGQARAVLATWRGVSSLGHRDADLVAALKAAADALPRDDPRRAEIVAELAAELAFTVPLEHRRALADEALTLARGTGDRRLLCQVLLQHAFAIWVAHTIDERVASLHEAVELSGRLADPALQFQTASRACNVIEAGDLDGFDARVARMTELLELVPQPLMRWILRFTEAPRALLGGDLEAAEALALEALQISGGNADGLTVFGGQIVSIRWEQGRLHEHVDLVAQAVVDNPAIPAFAGAHALALCSAGEPAHARELLAPLVADRFASIPLDLAWSTTLSNWSEVAFHAGVIEAAGPLYDLLLPHANTVVWNGAALWGPASRHLGRLALMLERLDDADQHLCHATAEHDRLGAPIWQADTDRLRGLVALRRSGGDSDHGRDLLRRAAETAGRHGAARIQRESEHALAQAARR
jgi:class 3 adenylate cyclase/tetratricopeptide (TPR) repeat protein